MVNYMRAAGLNVKVIIADGNGKGKELKDIPAYIPRFADGMKLDGKGYFKKLRARRTKKTHRKKVEQTKS